MEIDMKLRGIRWSYVGLALACWLPLGLTYGYPAMWQWSTVAATNATADPSINWREGMAPSAVNDSARAMMAVLAGWKFDVSGASGSIGTTTGYAIITKQAYPNLASM